MSPDNINGLILAVSSSIFIGSSFIIKKKGLKKAGASGVRAGFFFLFWNHSWIKTFNLHNSCCFLLFINDQVKEGTVTYLNHGGGLEW